MSIYLVSTDAYTEDYEWIGIKAFDSLAEAKEFGKTLVKPLNQYETTGAVRVECLEAGSAPMVVCETRPDKEDK